jgi:hypothetical protein
LTPITCASELLARADNRIKPYAKHTTSDAGIVRRIFLSFDFDSDRFAGISSTDAEHAAALQRAQCMRASLSASMHWPDPIVADSGNGAHVVYGIDLPNNEASLALVNSCLNVVAEKVGDEKKGICDGVIRIVVDTTVGNAARIWKVYLPGVPGTNECAAVYATHDLRDAAIASAKLLAAAR